MRLLSIALIGLLASGTAFGDSLVVNNNSDWVIVNMYLSESSSSEWGPDQLEEEVIGSGDRFILKGLTCGIYDVRLVDEDEDVCTLTELEFCDNKEIWNIDNDLLLSCQMLTEENNVQDLSGTMTLHNASSWVIQELYISSSEQEDWGEDILGSDTWASDSSVEVVFECGVYDLRIVDEAGDECQIKETTLCGDEGAVMFTDDILLECQGY